MNIGYILSLSLIVLTFVFFVLGVYLSMRFYRQLPYARDRGSVFLCLSILCFGFSIFFLITVMDGFSWETLVFSVVLTGILVLLVMFDSFIRRKTAMYLKKGNKVKTFFNLIKDSHGESHNEHSDRNIQNEE